MELFEHFLINRKVKELKNEIDTTVSKREYLKAQEKVSAELKQLTKKVDLYEDVISSFEKLISEMLDSIDDDVLIVDKNSIEVSTFEVYENPFKNVSELKTISIPVKEGLKKSIIKKYNEILNSKENMKNEKLEIYNRLKIFAKKHNTEPIDWNNHNQKKWSIKYDHEEGEICSYFNPFSESIGQITFTSRQLCREAIEEIGEDNIMKLFEED